MLTEIRVTAPQKWAPQKCAGKLLVTKIDAATELMALDELLALDGVRQPTLFTRAHRVESLGTILCKTHVDPRPAGSST
jgi:hypothetical protein